MQDQHPYKITPEQGWAKMRPILEEAMPTGQPTRRSPFVWWTTTAVIVTAVSSLLFLGGTTSMSDKPSTDILNAPSSAITLEQKVSKDLTPNSTASKSLGDKNVNASREINPSPIPSEKINNQPSATDLKKSTSISKNRVKSIPMAMAEAVNQPTAISANQNTSENEPISGPDVDALDYSSVESATYPYADLRNVQVLSPLKPSTEPSFVSPDFTEPAIPAGTVTKAKRQPALIQPNLAISSLIGAQGGIGLYGGAGANVNLGRHLSLTTAIGYLSYNPDASLLGSKRKLDASAGTNGILNYDPSYLGNEVYVESNAINKTAGYNEINSLVDKVTQWQVSAGLKWKINRRFFTEAGAQFGWNTRAYSAYPIIAPDPLTTPAVSFDNSLSDFNVIRSTSTSVYAGIGYRVGQHTDVFANWTHGLSHYILNDAASSTTDQFSGDRTDYIRGLSLGLRYTL